MFPTKYDPKAIKRELDKVNIIAGGVYQIQEDIVDINVNLGDASASITALATVVTDGDSALSQLITDLNVEVDDNTAGISSELIARADADTALASSITTLTATVDANTSSISAELIARADADTALASSITTLTSTVGANTGAITQEAIARATADTAQAQTSTAISGRVTTLEDDTTDADAAAVNASDIVDVNSLIVTNDSAYAERFELTAARFGITVDDTYDNSRTYQVGEEAVYNAILYRCTNITLGNVPTDTLFWAFQALVPAAISAAVQTEATARATAISALASDITTVTATANGNTSQIITEAIASAAADSLLQIDVNGAIAAAATSQATADGKIDSFYQTTAPASASEGDIWFDTDDGNTIYTYRSSVWTLSADSDIAQAILDASDAQATADGKVTSFYATTAPTAEGVGDFWVDIDDGNKLYRWNGTLWVDVQDGAIGTALAAAATSQATADGKIDSFYQTTAPAVASEGDIWFDTDDGNTIYTYRSGVWTLSADSGIAQAILDASGAQSTADGKVTSFYQTTAPTAEGVGDFWVDTDDDNKLYRWSGTVWVSVQDGAIGTAISNAASAQATADGKIDSFYQTTAPVTASEGDIWFDTDDGNTIYTYRSSVWTLSADSDIAQAILDASSAQATADGKIVSFYQTTAPTAEGIGDFWVDTDDGNKLYRWDGTSWVDVQDGSITQAISDAASAQSTADGKIDSFYQTTAPVTASEGDIWFDTDDGNTIYTYRSSVWTLSADSDIAQAILNASNAQATADGKVTSFYATTAPTAEGIGDFWVDIDDGNRLYRWSGSSWVSIRDASISDAQVDASQAISDAATAQGTADGKVTTFFVATAPTAEGIGDLWIDTDDGNKLYRWNGTSWSGVQDGAIGTAISDAATAQSTADGKIVSFYQTTAPTAEGVGDLWVDTDDGNRLYRWNGTSWVDVRDGGISQAIADAATSQATADGKIDSFYQATAPTVASEGDIWFDTDDGNTIYTYRSSVWTLSADSDIAQAILDASGAQATADGKVTSFYATEPPTAEGVGDFWVDTNDGNKLYRWSGSAWISVQDGGITQAIADAAASQATADGKIDSFYQTTAPVTASEGDIWFDTDDGNTIYTYRSSVWTLSADSGIAQAILDASDAQATADGKVTSFYATTAPTAEGVGDFWIDTDDGNKLYRWSGTVWVDVQDGGITQAIADAAASQATADGKIDSFYQTTAPTVASEGDIWFDTDDGNTIYTYRSSVWTLSADSDIAKAILDASDAQATADGKVTSFYATTAPTAEGVGDFWIDTDDGFRLYRWSGSAWVDVRDTGIAGAIADAAAAQAAADGKIETFFVPTAPTASGIGDLWFDTDDGNTIYRWNGSAWTLSADSDIAQAISDAAGAQGTADGKVTTFYQAAPPTAEGEGDLWVDTDDGNKLYRWDLSTWVDIDNAGIVSAIADAAAAQAAADGKIDSYYQATAPTVASEGDIWFDTDDGNKIYTYRSGVWTITVDTDIAVSIGAAAGAQATADGKVATFYQATAPTAEGSGDLWVDTDDGNKLYRWNLSSWVLVQDTAIPELEARYGVTLDVNEYITGFSQNNDGTTGTFKILADVFKIIDPAAGSGQAGLDAFTYSGGVVSLGTGVKLTADSIETGTLSADRISIDGNYLTVVNGVLQISQSFQDSTVAQPTEVDNATGNNDPSVTVTRIAGGKVSLGVDWSLSRKNGAPNNVSSPFPVTVSLKRDGTTIKTWTVTEGLGAYWQDGNVGAGEPFLAFGNLNATYLDNSGTTGTATYSVSVTTLSTSNFNLATQLTGQAIT